MEHTMLCWWLVCTLCVVSPTLARFLCLSGDFDQQVDALFNYIRLSDERLENITQAPRDIEHVLQPRWPGCKVMAYGSTVTGLALKSSDIDCYVEIPDDDTDPQSLMADVLHILQTYPNLFQHFEIIAGDRIPLITCVHVPSNVFVDITFSSSFPVNSSRLLFHLLHLDQRAFDLATIIKYWASVHNIANGKLTLPSYAIVLMTVFYLQQKNIMPPVAALQVNAVPYELDYWNTGFQPIKYHTNNNETLYELLGGFFKYYSNFDFENTVISPYVGYPIKRKHFEDLNKLDIFPLYKRNIVNGYTAPFNFGHLNIQDTFKHSENIARPKSDRWLATRLIKHVRASAKIYERLSREEFLTALLVPENRAGSLKTYWSGGVGAPKDCKLQEKVG